MKFWDSKINKNKESIQNYPIYILKNNYVLSILKKVSGSFLDVGIGYGFLENRIVKEHLNLDLFGIDISEVAVSNAKNNFNGKFKKAHVQSIPFKSNFFNCVVALDVIEHLTSEDGKKSVKEIYRVVKKNGLIIVSVPTNETESDRKNNGHMVEYSQDTISDLIVNSGFIIKKIKLFSAFKKNTLLKNLINNLIKIKKPNLIIVTAIKK